MRRVDQESRVKLAERLAIGFYVLMFLALALALAGSAGSGFLLLALGGCAHVARVGVEGSVADARLSPSQRPAPLPRDRLSDEAQASLDRDLRRSARAKAGPRLARRVGERSRG
jgi:hypothetical protein